MPVFELPSLQLTPPNSFTHKLTRIIANGDRISDMIVDIDCAFFNVGVGPPRTCEGLDEKSSFAVGYGMMLVLEYCMYNWFMQKNYGKLVLTLCAVSFFCVTL